MSHMSDSTALNLDWLLRELELTAVVAMRRAAPELVRYVELLQTLPRVDACHDEAFHQQLSRYVGLRGKLRMQREAVFEIVEQFKSDPTPRFETILARLSALTGQVEKSVASAVLALVDPLQPVIDRDLRQLLPRYGFPLLAEAPLFDDCVAWHSQLNALFAEVFASPQWQALKARQIAQLTPELNASLNDVRLLNAHLSQARRIVSLMALPRVSASKAPAGAPAESQQPRLAVRLHLCR